jgi:hypothetical protein
VHLETIRLWHSSEVQFRALFDYSPYHHVRDGIRYPAMLIVAGAEDDNVFAAHSLKSPLLSSMRSQDRRRSCSMSFQIAVTTQNFPRKIPRRSCCTQWG